MKTFYINPREITVKKIVGRVRKDMGDIKELAKSFEALGQIVPIVITDKNELIDGARRLSACIILNREIFCVIRENINDEEMKALELEANIKRKNFTYVEELEGIQFLHEMKKKKDPSWKIEDTGAILGIEKSTVSKKLQAAKVVDEFPELKKLKNESDVNKAIKQIAKTIARVNAVKSFEEKEDNPYNIKVQSAEEACYMLEDKSVNLLITDPPYGIDIDESMKAMMSPTTFSYTDDIAASVFFYQLLAKQSFNFVKDNGHVFVFHAPELYQIVKDLFVSAGWKTNHRPIIWIKHPSGQTNQPSMWPSACYEMCMYFRKDASKLIVEGRPDWVQFNPVPPEKKLHPSEKPVELIQDLMQRTCLPGDVIFDPFMGSGAIVEAAILENLVPIASDKAQECYTMTMSRIAELEGKTQCS